MKLKKILEEPAINSKSVAPRVYQKKIVFHSKKAMMSVGQVMISASYTCLKRSLPLASQEPAVAYLGWIGFNFCTLGLDFFQRNASVSGSTEMDSLKRPVDCQDAVVSASVDGKWDCEV